MKKTFDGIVYDTDGATSVMSTDDKHASIIYQMPGEDGAYFLHRIDANKIEPLTKFEVQRLVNDVTERIQIEAEAKRLEYMLTDHGIEVTRDLVEEAIDKVHRELREQGHARGTTPNLRKFLGR